MSVVSPLIDVRDLRRCFTHANGQPGQRTVLDALRLSIHDGELVCLTGASGVGKTTLLAILAGLDRGFDGAVFVRGRDIKLMSDVELARYRSSTVGVVFQSFHLFNQMSVLDNTMLPFVFANASVARRERERRALDALAQVGMHERASDLAAHLSGGQRQRVAVARAIVLRPALLLCDEPTGNLDPQTARQVIDVFERLHCDGGVTILCATHDRRLRRVATRQINLEQGQLREVESEREDGANEGEQRL